MKKFLTQFWWLPGLLSTISLGLCPQIGWYALANAAVWLTGLYMMHQASARKKRLEKNQDVLSAMTRKQYQAFRHLDEKELKNIQALSRMMPWLGFGCLALNLYTWYYNESRHLKPAIVSAAFFEQSGVLFLAAGLLLGVLFIWTWKLAFHQMLIALPAGKTPQHKSIL